MIQRHQLTDVYYGKTGDERTQQNVKERIHWICKHVQGERILDAACGQGIKSILLGREGFHVLGIDTNEQAIADANEQLQHEDATVRKNVSFLVKDVMTTPLEETPFDTVIVDGVIEHLIQPRRFLEKMRDVLADNGRIIITVPLGINQSDPHTTRTYYLATLLSETESFFKLHDVHIVGQFLCYIGEKRESQQPTDPVVAMSIIDKVERALSQREHELHEQLMKLEAKEVRLKEADVRMIELQHECKLLRAEITQLAKDKEKLIKDLKRAEFGIQLYSKRVHEIVSNKDKNIHYLRGRLAVTEQSTKYRLGSAIVNSVRNPLTLPKNVYLMARMVAGKLRRKLNGIQRKYKLPELPYEDVTLPRVSDMTGLTSAEARYVLAGGGLNELLLTGLHDPKSHQELKVAAILDEFSTSCFAPDCQLITFRPDNWREMLTTEFPHLLLVESAWKGNGGSWQYKIAKYNIRQGNELDQLLLWCKNHNVPTVFWNKEDPVHFDRFIQTAKKFDIIFTSDVNCVDKYKEVVEHDRVYVLPFAAQPMLHNPIKVKNYKQKDVCFAGSYYANRHPERRRDMEYLLDSALGKGLEIYDRNYGSDAPDFQFPERFRASIKGSLPYEKLVHAYKMYKVFLNTNSVTDSPTMFSRRIFELLACGTTIVSNYSKGIAEMFGDHVLIVNKDNAEATLTRALTDDEWRRKNELAGIRAVLSEHTYRHRLHTIATKCGYELDEPYNERIALIGYVETDEEAERLIRMFREQSYTNSHLYLYLQKPIEGIVSDDRITLRAADEASDEYEEDFVGIFSPQHYYGKYYVEDLVHAFKYSRADVVGKACMFAWDHTSGTVSLEDSDMENIYTTNVQPEVALFRSSMFAQLNVSLREVLDEGNLFTVAQFGARIYASDRYNFIKNLSADTIDRYEDVVRYVTA